MFSKRYYCRISFEENETPDITSQESNQVATETTQHCKDQADPDNYDHLPSTSAARTQTNNASFEIANNLLTTEENHFLKNLYFCKFLAYFKSWFDSLQKIKLSYSHYMPNLPNSSSLPLKKRKLSFENDNPQIKEELPSWSEALPRTFKVRPRISLPLKKMKICNENKQQESVSQNNNTPSEALPPMNEIGANKTLVPTKDFDKIEWASASRATRKLLDMVFGRHILASHTLTGKPSPVFRDESKPLKKMLDPVAVSDIISVVTEKSNVSEKTVRKFITNACSDASKLMRLQDKKAFP